MAIGAFVTIAISSSYDPQNFLIYFIYFIVFIKRGDLSALRRKSPLLFFCLEVRDWSQMESQSYP